MLTSPNGERQELDTVNNVPIIGSAVLREGGVEIAATDLHALFEEFMEYLAQGTYESSLREFLASPEAERTSTSFAGVAFDGWAARAAPQGLTAAGESVWWDDRVCRWRAGARAAGRRVRPSLHPAGHPSRRRHHPER